MEQSESDISHVFLIFYEVLRFYEGYYSSIDIDVIFTSAEILEKFYRKLESLGAVEEFEKKLNEFWTIKGLNHLPLQFFKNSSHLVLTKFITDRKFSDLNVSSAIKRFMVNKSENDFIELVQELVHTNRSVEFIKKEYDKSVDTTKYSAVVCLEEFKKSLVNSNGNAEEVFSTISQIDTDNKDMFKILLSVLRLSDNDELSVHIQEIVALSVMNLLRDYDNVHLYGHVLELNDKDVHDLVTRWQPFCTTFFKMIEFSVTKLKCDYSYIPYSWTYTGAEKGLSFDYLIALVNKLKVISEIFDTLKEFLNRLADEGYRIIVDDLLRICKFAIN